MYCSNYSYDNGVYLMDVIHEDNNFADVSKLLDDVEDKLHDRYLDDWSTGGLIDPDKQRELRNRVEDINYEARNKFTKTKYYDKTFNPLEKLYMSAQSAIGRGRDFVARFIDKLNAWMRKIIQEQDKVPEEKRGFFHKVKNYIVRIIQWLSKHAHNIIQYRRGKIADMDDSTLKHDHDLYLENKKKGLTPQEMKDQQTRDTSNGAFDMTAFNKTWDKFNRDHDFVAQRKYFK